METSKQLDLGQIGQIGLSVRNIEKAVAFYRDVLGIRLLFQMPNMAFFDCNGVRVMLTLPEKSEYDKPGSVIYLRTSDIHDTYEELVKRGVEFSGKPHLIADLGSHEEWMAFFQDPDGNPLALMSAIPKA